MPGKEHATLKTCLLTLLTTLTLLIASGASAREIHYKVDRAGSDRPVSPLQVMDYINKRHQGDAIGFKKTPQEGYPDCYVVRFMTIASELHIIRVNCKK